MKSTDLIGGYVILLSVAFGIAEYIFKDGNVVFFDFLPYAVGMIIGLIIAYHGECENA